MCVRRQGAVSYDVADGTTATAADFDVVPVGARCSASSARTAVSPVSGGARTVTVDHTPRAAGHLARIDRNRACRHGHERIAMVFTL